MAEGAPRRRAAARLRGASRIAVLTGSGLSAASGIPTFRGPAGLWRHHRAEELATPRAYARDPVLVWEWYKMRFETVRAAQPNRAHRLLADLQRRVPALTLATQNVDGLHQRAGSKGVLELHGNITLSRCERCGHKDRLEPGFAIPPSCSVCAGRARPNAVWFGEAVPGEVLARAAEAFAGAEAALVVGTSALVEPAASLARLAAERGACLIEVNPEATPLSALADLSLREAAVEGLGALLEG